MAECCGSAGVCDVPESCDGVGDECPADGFQPASFECRAAGGVCDLPEACTGFAADCPDDAKSTAVCRPAAGACDVPETCDGVSDHCAWDALVEAGTLCRPSTDACDPLEECTGLAAACPEDIHATCSLCGEKFYDADASGTREPGELGIPDWLLELTGGGGTVTARTEEGGLFTFTGLAEGDYTVCEALPAQGGWMQTAPPEVCFDVRVPSEAAETCTAVFGNLCLGGGGGMTLGTWTNKNGRRIFLDTDDGASSLALLQSLPLVDGAGAPFDPTSYAQVQKWMRQSTAVNLAYKLSAQLAATDLAVLKGRVDASALIYAPGTEGASPLGYSTVGAVVDEAIAELALHPYVPGGSPFRVYQAALESALNDVNRNASFVQAAPCEFSFPVAAALMIEPLWGAFELF